jgi:hypothetical protein
MMGEMPEISGTFLDPKADNPHIQLHGTTRRHRHNSPVSSTILTDLAIRPGNRGMSLHSYAEGLIVSYHCYAFCT